MNEPAAPLKAISRSGLLIKVRKPGPFVPVPSVIKLLAKAKAKPNIIMPRPSSKPTTEYKALVRLPEALYSWIIATVPAGALAGAIAPNIIDRGRFPVNR